MVTDGRQSLSLCRQPLSLGSRGRTQASKWATTDQRPVALEPLAVVAMLFGEVAAWFSLFVLRLIFRPAG